MQKQAIEEYYADNARKLRRTADRILLKFGGLSGRDMDDFYSIANETFWDAAGRYDGRMPFDGFLYACLSNRFKSEITKRNRMKRAADRMCVPLDMPIKEGGGCTIGDMLADSSCMEEAEGINALSSKLERYLRMLSKRQREVLEMLSWCHKAAEIQEALHITRKEYAEALEGIRAYEKIKILL